MIGALNADEFPWIPVDFCGLLWVLMGSSFNFNGPLVDSYEDLHWRSLDELLWSIHNHLHQPNQPNVGMFPVLSIHLAVICFEWSTQVWLPNFVVKKFHVRLQHHVRIVFTSSANSALVQLRKVLKTLKSLKSGYLTFVENSSSVHRVLQNECLY